MERFSRNKLNITLSAAAFILAGLLFWYTIAAAHFLVVTFQEAHDKNLLNTSEIVTFNLTKAREVQQR